MAEKDRQTRGTPENFPVTSPGVPGTGEHTGLILTRVMELQRTIGALNNAVESLTLRADEQGKNLSKISHQVYAAIAVITVAGLVLSGLGGVSIFILNKIWDVAARHF